MKYRPEIRAMSGYQPGEQPQTGKFIKLNTNENPYPCSDAVARAIHAATESGLARYPDPVAAAFRNRAASLLGVDADWILCGNGSDDILTIVTRTFVGSGELLRMPHPSYTLYRTLAEIQGARCEVIRFQDDWTLPPEFAAASENLRLVFLANPNSPSGTMVSPQRVADLAAQLPCPLLVDEAYVDFADSNCVDLVKANERILVSRSLSKSYALAGLRFGFVVAQPQVIEQLAKVKDSYNCGAISIAAATAAIDDQSWLRVNREKIIASRRRLESGLEHLGFDVQPSQANFVWCSHPERPARLIYERLKADCILVRYLEYENWGSGLRISVGTNDQLDACLSRIRSYFESP